ncbi:O-antigen translocase [Dryocola clanedunensis]
MNFAKITILSGVLTLLKLLCGFFISKMVAIFTGPSGMASLGQLQNLVTFINGFVSSQVSQGINRYSSEYKQNYEEAKYYWRAAVKLSIVACFFIVCIGVVCSPAISNYLFNNKMYFWIVILALSVVPLNVINNIFLGVLNGLGEHNKFFIANACTILSSVVSMVLLVYYFGLVGALISTALNNAISGILLLAIVRRCEWFKFKYWFGSVAPKYNKEMRNYFAMGIIGALTGPISLILVRSIVTSELSQDYAGYWQAVFKISEAYLAVLTTALTVYYFPRTAAAKTIDEYLSTLKVGAMVVVPCAIVFSSIIFLSKDMVIHILFSQEFIKAKELFLFQNIGDFFRISSWLFATILLAKGYFKTNAFLEVFFSLLFPCLTMWFIKAIGFKGVSLAYLITYVSYFACVVVIYSLHLKRLRIGT